MIETINGIDLISFIAGAIIFFVVGRITQRNKDRQKRSRLNLG